VAASAFACGPSLLDSEAVADHPGIRDLSAIVLVGGLGTRLGPVAGGLPKPMVPVAGRPFLEHLVRWLARSGVGRVVLAVGHRAGSVEAHFGDGAKFGVHVAYSCEAEPLGTGGALRQAAQSLGRWPILGLNGDSFAAVDIHAMLASHAARGARVTVALTEVPQGDRFGRVRLGRDDAILGFAEKSSGGPGLVSAGVYLLERDAVGMIPPGRSSLEHETLPRLAGHGAYGFVTRGFFVDIGVPADYQRLEGAPERFLRAMEGGLE